jgi:hypothetical protein
VYAFCLGCKKAENPTGLMMPGAPHHQGNISLDAFVSIHFFSNHLAAFSAVIITWWTTLLLVQGMGFGPQGQGDF